MAKGMTKAQEALSPLDRIRKYGDPDAVKELSYEELLAAAQTLPSDEAMYATQTGDGLLMLKDKSLLVGVPFIITSWDKWPSRERPGTYFTTVVCKTAQPIPKMDGAQDFRFNDGGSGIHAQLDALRKNGFQGMLICENGLRVSKDYLVTEDQYDEATGEPVIDPETGRPKQVAKKDPVTGHEIHGTTYFLDNSL